MNILLFGPPGAGKGTQADNLVKEFNFFKVSTGDLIRNEINKDNSLGRKMKSFIDVGKLVPDADINDLIEKILSNKKYFDRLIFDGYPRNSNQAKSLDSLLNKHDQKIKVVFSLKVDQKTIVKRILGRQVCSKCGLIFNTFFNKSIKEKHSCESKYLKTRSDDNEETLKERLKIYEIETSPVLNYYRGHNLLNEVDGMREIHEIYKEIRGIIRSLES